jgi:hypothetical protein
LNGQQQASVLIAVCAPQIFAFSFTVLPLVYQNIACVHLKIFAFLTPPLFILFLGNICRRNKVALSLGNALSFIVAGEGDYVLPHIIVLYLLIQFFYGFFLIKFN